MALSDDDLRLLNPSQRDAYAEAVRRCEDDHQLVRSASYGQPWRNSYTDSWKSEFGEAVGFLFFLGSVVLFPAALGIVGALELNSENGMAPVIAVYVALLLGVAALKATVTADRPPPRPPIEKLRAERLASVDAHWRDVVARQRGSGSGGKDGRPVQHGRAAPRDVGRTSTTPPPKPSNSNAPISRSSPQAGGDGARVLSGAEGGSITSGNRSVPGAEYTPWISAEEKLAIANSFDWVCQLCLRPIDPTINFDYESPNPDRLVIDHIKPRKHGGTHDRSNLQPAHHRCNSRKRDRRITNEEYRRWDAETKSGSAARPSKGGAGTTSGSSLGSPSEARIRREPASATRSPRPTGPQAQRAPIGSRDKQTRAQRERSDMFWSKPHEGLLTHCEKGHEFTEENTYYRLRPDRSWGIERECRVCRRD